MIVNIKFPLLFRCSRAFSDPSNFRRHKLIVHDKVKQYRCVTCGFESLTKGDMKRHVSGKSHLEAVKRLQDLERLKDFEDRLKKC